MSDLDRIIADLDDDFLEDFLESTNTEQVVIEQNLMYLHIAKNTEKRLNNLIVPIQKLKMNCRLGFMDPLLAFVQSAEDLIDAILFNKFEVTEDLSELLLLIFDEIRGASEELVSQRTLDEKLLGEFHNCIKSLININPSQQVAETIIKDMIQVFSPRVHPDIVFSAFETHLIDDSIINIPQDEDLDYFEGLSNFLDNRYQYWEGRTKTLLNICLILNSKITNPVDEAQLTAAVYMHDIGMGFLPDRILEKKSRYDSLDIMLLQQHPTQIYELLRRMPNWNMAAQMVHQHHEKVDGSGYPNGLEGDNICTGAKILSLADTYYALTNTRADRDYKKSVLRSVSEINRCSGTQLDPTIVTAFNSAISLVIKNQKK